MSPPVGGLIFVFLRMAFDAHGRVVNGSEITLKSRSKASQLCCGSFIYRFPFFRFLRTRKIASPATRNLPTYSPSRV